MTEMLLCRSGPTIIPHLCRLAVCGIKRNAWPDHALYRQQARVLVNIEQQYQHWIETERELAAMPYDLRRKQVGDRSYLYEIDGRDGNGRSLGPWSPDNEAAFTTYREKKAILKGRRDGTRAALNESCRLYRAVRLPLLANAAGDVLREADRRNLLGSRLLVVGTNAIPVYYGEAAGFIHDMPDETLDFDLAWSAREADSAPMVWPMLKAVDPTYTVNAERPFQARNAKAFEVALLAAPSTLSALPPMDRPRPISLPEQEWLLLGRNAERVVVCRDNSPARIVAPDPRWFALQKLWLSEKPQRTPAKKPKDLKQGLTLLNAVWTTMPHYPLDVEFEQALPPELAPYFARWKAQRPEQPTPRW